MVLGEKKAREKLIEEFKNNTPTIYTEKVKIIYLETFIVDELAFNLSKSVHLTIRKRYGFVKKIYL